MPSIAADEGEGERDGERSARKIKHRGSRLKWAIGTVRTVPQRIVAALPVTVATVFRKSLTATTRLEARVFVFVG